MLQKGGVHLQRRKWLVEIREGKGYTQEQVAAAANIKRAYYTQIENGVRTPSVPVAQKIAAILHFEWTFFFDDR
ncbi:DNA-binding helix-turn-helix protein [Aneurinibacillus migulanus]|nr:DNA-binding helix-turn-helix protein [Aneurinibacillus migulanus]